MGGICVIGVVEGGDTAAVDGAAVEGVKVKGVAVEGIAVDGTAVVGWGSRLSAKATLFPLWCRWGSPLLHAPTANITRWLVPLVTPHAALEMENDMVAVDPEMVVLVNVASDAAEVTPKFAPSYVPHDGDAVGWQITIFPCMPLPARPMAPYPEEGKLNVTKVDVESECQATVNPE